MNSLVAPRKEKDDKYATHFFCNYCKKHFKDQCCLFIHAKFNHPDELKAACSRRALSHPSGSFNAHCTVPAIPCKPTGRPARARITGKTFFIRGQSSSAISNPLASLGSSSQNSSSLPVLQNLSSSHFGAAGVHSHGDSSSSFQTPSLTQYCPGYSLNSVNGTPYTPAYNRCGLRSLAPAVTPPCSCLGQNLIHTFKEPIPTRPSLLSLCRSIDQLVAGVPHMNCPIHHKYNQGLSTGRASTLKTSGLMSSLANPMTNCSSRQSKPDCSCPAQELALSLGMPGVSSASSKEEDAADLDLSLHL